MYALAFDLVVAEAERHHPVGATRAYHDIREVLTGQFGFEWTQGSLYVLRDEDMSILFRAIQSLMQLAWFLHPSAIFARSALSSGRTSRQP